MRKHPPNIAHRLIAQFVFLGLIVMLFILVPPGCKKHDIPKTKDVDIQLIADGFASPIQVVAAPNNERLYVVDQIGKVWVIDKDGNKRSNPLIDLTSKMIIIDPAFDERGLLGLAFHTPVNSR